MTGLSSSYQAHGPMQVARVFGRLRQRRLQAEFGPRHPVIIYANGQAVEEGAVRSAASLQPTTPILTLRINPTVSGTIEENRPKPTDNRDFTLMPLGDVQSPASGEVYHAFLRVQRAGPEQDTVHLWRTEKLLEEIRAVQHAGAAPAVVAHMQAVFGPAIERSGRRLSCAAPAH